MTPKNSALIGFMGAGKTSVGNIFAKRLGRPVVDVDLYIEEIEKKKISDIFEKEECFLRMNNFPEEPLWTLFYKGESIDFDDTPPKWNITYRSEM